MLKTEDEAKKIWCPDAGDSRFDRQTEYCIASQCMAWRWQTVEDADQEAKAWEEANDDTCPMPNRLKGYCGRAGKP